MVRLVFSPLRRRRTICPSVSARALARVSPDFAFFRHFPGFFRVWYSNHSHDHGQWQVCMCVCVRVCLCIVCVVWCCEVRKYTKKTRETLGKLSKHGLLFWHDLAIHGPKNGPKLIIFPNALFLRFPWDLPTILDRGPNPNAQERRFSTEVLFQRS